MWKVKQIKMAGKTIYRVYREFEKDGVEYTQYAAYGKQPPEKATEKEAQNIADHLNRKKDEILPWEREENEAKKKSNKKAPQHV